MLHWTLHVSAASVHLQRIAGPHLSAVFAPFREHLNAGIRQVINCINLPFMVDKAMTWCPNSLQSTDQHADNICSSVDHRPLVLSFKIALCFHLVILFLSSTGICVSDSLSRLMMCVLVCRSPSPERTEGSPRRAAQNPRAPGEGLPRDRHP